VDQTGLTLLAGAVPARDVDRDLAVDHVAGVVDRAGPDNYRLRLLLHCGIEWNTLRATPIRGRLPRSAA